MVMRTGNYDHIWNVECKQGQMKTLYIHIIQDIKQCTPWWFGMVSYRKCAVVMVTLWLGNNSICDTVCAIQLCNISLTLCVCDTAHNSGFVSIQTPLYLTVGTLWRSETMLCLICETFILFFSAEFADKKQQLRWLQCESERETARERMQGVCEDTMRRWRTETAAALKIIQT